MLHVYQFISNRNSTYILKKLNAMMNVQISVVLLPIPVVSIKVSYSKGPMVWDGIQCHYDIEKCTILH